ncbi:MAG: 2-hydroxychromene-2-carboxylate isomerase [Gammaproteobacteria bacterium]|nr:2-hydroxychromene-2-carboxylate isomerase [Gammaproteobacteria bacterium]
MSHRIECYFDCSSPWTWLAFEYLQQRTRDLDVTIEWKPILVGGIFNTVNPSVYQSRETPVPLKAAYMRKDLQDWARHVGVTIHFPPPVFPVNSVKAMRGAWLAVEAGCLVPYAREVFRRYWTELADISQDEVLAPIAEGVGFTREAFFAGIARQDIKDRLRLATEECVARGGFGSPTLFLDGEDMYFGNDRIDLMLARLAR